MERIASTPDFTSSRDINFDKKLPRYGANVYNQLDINLATGRYDFAENGKTVHVDVSDVEGGQLITLTTKDEVQINVSIMRVKRELKPEGLETLVTAYHTRTFVDSDEPSVIKQHYPLPDKVGRLRDNYEIAELARDIELAKKAVTNGEVEVPDASV
jgi:hypothetical protein